MAVLFPITDLKPIWNLKHKQPVICFTMVKQNNITIRLCISCHDDSV